MYLRSERLTHYVTVLVLAAGLLPVFLQNGWCDNSTLSAFGRAYQQSYYAEKQLGNASAKKRAEVKQKIFAPAFEKAAEDLKHNEEKALKNLASRAGHIGGHYRKLADKKGVEHRKKGGKDEKSKKPDTEQPPSAPRATGREVEENNGPVEQGGATSVSFSKKNKGGANKPTAGASGSSGASGNAGAANSAPTKNSNPSDTGGASSVSFGKKK